MARSHILQHHFTRSLQGARLDSLHEEQSEITLKIRVLMLRSSELFEHDRVVQDRIWIAGTGSSCAGLQKQMLDLLQILNCDAASNQFPRIYK